MLSILKNRRNSVSYAFEDPEEQSSFTTSSSSNSSSTNRQRRHTVSADSSPIPTEPKIPKSASASKLISKLFGQKSDNNVVDEYFNVSEDWDTPVEVTATGGVIFRVKKKLFIGPNKGQIVNRQLVIDISGISEYEPSTLQLLHVYKFEDIKAFFYSDDNCFFVIQYADSSTQKPAENVVWKHANQVHRIKSVVNKQIQDILEAKKANKPNNENVSRSKSPSSNTSANTMSPTTPPGSFDWLSDEESTTPSTVVAPTARLPNASSDLISFD